MPIRLLVLACLVFAFGCDADSVIPPDLAVSPCETYGGGNSCYASCPDHTPYGATFEPDSCLGTFSCDYPDRKCTCNGGVPGFFCFIKQDMSASRIGCKSYAPCMSDCFANNPTPTLSNCMINCDQNAKISGFAKWQPMAACARTYCLSGGDGGSYKCTPDTDGMTPVDRVGDPAGTCKLCLANAIAAGNGTACSDASSPDCNPAVCKDVTDACLSDLP